MICDLVTVDRDSVSAGDDTDPHRTTFRLPPTATVGELLAAAWRACPLASIAGGRATWLIDVGAPAHCIGVMAQQWQAPRLLVGDVAAATLFAHGTRSVFFRYWAQSDPDAVFEALRSGAPLPDKHAQH